MKFLPEHELFRDSVRAFVAREIAPHVDAWDEAETFPRELYARAAQVGLLGIGYPEAYGGTPADGWYRLIATEEIARAGSGGLMASLFSHNIGLPPIAGARLGGAEAAHRAGGAARREDRRAGDHRALGRLRRRAAAHHRAARRRALGHRRREGLHHLGHAGRLDHASPCAPAARARPASR